MLKKITLRKNGQLLLYNEHYYMENNNYKFGNNYSLIIWNLDYPAWQFPLKGACPLMRMSN